MQLKVRAADGDKRCFQHPKAAVAGSSTQKVKPDIFRFRITGQGIGHEHVVDAGKRSGINQGSNPGLLGLFVKRQAGFGGLRVIADVDVVGTRGNCGFQQAGWQGAKRAGALHHQINLPGQIDQIPAGDRV